MAPDPPSADWSFARRPFWLFSHVFAVTVVVVFVVLGLWQLDRHGERADRNAVIRSRSAPPASALADVAPLPGPVTPTDVDYRYVTATGRFLDGDVVRIANRTQGGVAGQHLVGLFEVTDGRLLLVNRGFVPLDVAVGPGTGSDRADIEIEPAPSGEVTVTGWFRVSAERGWLGASDSGEGDVAPRLDVKAIGGRLDGDDRARLLDVWLLAEGSSDRGLARFPDPVPLPAVDAGPHLGYMAQWFIFAALGVIVYGLLLRRTARGRSAATPSPGEPMEPGTDPGDARPVEEAHGGR